MSDAIGAALQGLQRTTAQIGNAVGGIVNASSTSSTGPQEPDLAASATALIAATISDRADADIIRTTSATTQQVIDELA